MDVQPFTINISPYVIEDLRERLGRARWPDEISGSGWEYGTNMGYLQELCTHWGHGFDWKEQESALNCFHHYQARVDDFCLHFLHEQGSGIRRIPLLLIHGWPDSFVRFLKLIPLLTNGGADGVAFDLVIPSIPGFGFSEKPSEPGMDTRKCAELFAGLMKRLGYKKYLVHGGDTGSGIAEEMALQFPGRIMGLHLTDLPYQHLLMGKPEDLKPVEKAWFAAGQQWQMQEGAYALEQATKPQTLAYALNDSPVGLAAWIIEKFHSWSDCDGNLETIYTRDELLTNLTIYWVTQTAGSAARIYYEGMHHPRREEQKIKTPTAFYISPKDLVPAPREAAERIFTVKQWTQPARGGHFAAWEQPQPLADDLFKFARECSAQPEPA